MSVSEGYGYDDPTDAHLEGHEPYVIDGDRLAAWALRRIAEHQAEIDRVQAIASVDKAAVDQWAADATRAPQRSKEFLTGCLLAYRDRLEADDPEMVTKRRTYKLPGGELKRTKGRLSVRVVDEDAFLAWADEYAPHAVKRSPLVSAVKPSEKSDYFEADGRVVTLDGEVVPGVEAVTADDALTVKVTAEPKGGQR